MDTNQPNEDETEVANQLENIFSSATSPQKNIASSDKRASEEDEVSNELEDIFSAKPKARVEEPRGSIYARKVANLESSGDANAQSKTSTATGLHQFTKGTWLDLVKNPKIVDPETIKGKSDDDLLQMRHDPAFSAKMADAYADQNAEFLNKNDVAVTDGTLYAAHHFGRAGAKSLYYAPDNTPLEKLFTTDVMNANPDLKGKTAGDLKTQIAKSMGEDYFPKHYDLNEFIKTEGQNFLPDVKRGLASIASSVMGAVADPQATMAAVIPAAKSLAVGLKSKVDGWAGKEQDQEQKVKDEALIDALASQKKREWTSWEGLTNYLANHPFDAAMDITLVTPFAEAAVAKSGAALSGLGDVSRISALRSLGEATGRAGEAIGAAGRFVNPLNPGEVFTRAVSPGAKTTGFFGGVNKKLDQLVKAETGMSFAELPPEAQKTFDRVIGKKGISPETVREAVVKSAIGEDAEIPSSITTRTAPPHQAREAVDIAKSNNNARIANAAEQVAGALAPSSSGVGNEFENAYVKSINGAKENYKRLAQTNGSFGNALEPWNVNGEIYSNLHALGIPATSSLLQRSANSYPETLKAVNMLQDRLLNGKTALGGDIDARELSAISADLTSHLNAAQGRDVAGVRAVIDSFLNSTERSANAGKFVDNAGNVITTAPADLRAARAAYKNHFDTFEDSASPAIRSATKELKNNVITAADGSIVPTNDSAVHQIVQGKLQKDLFDNIKGPHTYNNLVSALGGTGSSGETAVHDFIKQSFIKPGAAGLDDAAKTLATKGSPSVFQRAFRNNPSAHARAKLLHAADAINNARPKSWTAHHNFLSNIVSNTLMRAGAAATGHIFGGIPGIIAGIAIENLIERGISRRAILKSLTGAPVARSKMMALINAAVDSAYATVKPTYAGQQVIEQNRPQRASGGRVMNHAAAADRLIAAAERTKKSQSKTTEPLLNHSDDAIATALAVANKHI